MLLAIFLLSGAAAVAATGLFGTSRFTAMTIAVAVEGDDPRMAPLIRMLGSVPDIEEYAEVRLVEQDEAVALVRGGQAAAALVLPAGFMDSVLTGENLSPVLLVDTARPVETLMLSKLARSTVRMLSSTQQGIAYTLAVYDLAAEAEVDRWTVAEAANLDFFQWVLGSSAMYRRLTVNTTGQLTVMQHYLLCAVLFFMLLATPVLYRLFSLGENAGWTARLRAAGCPLWKYALAQLLAGFLAVLLMAVLLLFGIRIFGGGNLAPNVAALVPAVLLCAAFITCFSYLCSNCGGILAAVGVNFLLAAAFVLVSGGLLPRAMLPGPLAALGPYSPVSWMMGALRPLFGVGQGGAALLYLGLATAVLLAGCLGVSAVAERRRRVA